MKYVRYFREQNESKYTKIVFIKLKNDRTIAIKFCSAILQISAL